MQKIKQKQDENKEYISLREAARLCSYSHEYLSLRARQGRLKSLKLGGTWVTKEEWVKDYIAKTEERHNNAKLRTQKKLKKRGKKQRTMFKVLVILTVMSLATSLFLSEKALILGIEETFTGTLIIFKEYGQWASSQTAAIGQKTIKQDLKPLQEKKEPILIKRIEVLNNNISTSTVQNDDKF